jgi:hypothetical protein
MFLQSKMKQFKISTISKIRSHLAFTITIYPMASYRLIEHSCIYVTKASDTSSLVWVWLHSKNQPKLNTKYNNMLVLTE